MMPREHKLRIFRVIRVFRKTAVCIHGLFICTRMDGRLDGQIEQNLNGIMYGVCVCVRVCMQRAYFHIHLMVDGFLTLITTHE